LFEISISKKKTKNLISSLLILSIFFSLVILGPTKAADPIQQPNQAEGNNVSWQSQQNTTQESWNWTSQGWQFGPIPTFIIILQNGSVVTDTNYIPLGQTFTTQIDVQKSIFVGNATLGQAGLQWNADLRSDNGTITGNANARMMYVNMMEYSNPSKMQQSNFTETNTWHIESSINNQTGSGNIAQPPQPKQLPPQSGFYQFDSQLSNVTETGEGWRIQIVGSFNSSTPMQPYFVNLQITDQYNNWVDVNSQSGPGTTSSNRMVAVGEPSFMYGGSQDTWAFEKLDMQNNPVLSVSKGAKWMMRFNVTSAQFSNITVGINLPWNIQEFVNVTNWYQKVVTDQGGWMYNDTSGTYYWNSTALITRNEQVYGPHLEQRWTSLQNNNHPINVTNQMWDPATNTSKMMTQQQYVSDQLYLIYNQANKSFAIKVGYGYSSYDEKLQRYVNYQVLNDINASDPSSKVYDLSLSDCTSKQIAPNKWVVEFVGLFSNSTSYSQDQYNLNVNVFNANNQIWANWQNTDPSAFQVFVDRPVAVSTILDSQGRQSTSSMFQINQGASFIVQSQIYGSSQIYENLDAVGVAFRSNFGTWSANQSSNSEVEIRLVKNVNTGQITSLSYNRTNVNMYVYGEHQGWAFVNVTDWHTEYNLTEGTWDWVESPHLIWNQTSLTDWHWAYYRLNQTEYARNPNSPNIWIDTTTNWVDNMDPAFLVPSYANLNSANVTSTDGIVQVNLNVTFNPTAPQGNYGYNMIFQNMTYGQDPSQGWGEHQITEWISEPTYYINGTVTDDLAWLVDEPSNPLYTTYNGTKYQVNQTPYITINGTNLMIKPQIQYDQMQQQNWIQYLLNDPYNPSLGQQPQYYQLLNGTKIYVNQAYQTIIRSIQLNMNDTYLMVNGLKFALPNGTAVDTYMSRAIQDGSEQFFDPSVGNIVPYHYELLNGTRIYRNAPFEQSVYNGTSNHWEISNQAYIENDAALLVQSVSSGVRLNNTVVLLRDPGNWQPLADGSGYYLVMKNGTRITIQNPYSVQDNQRFVTIGGFDYLIGWPDQYYQALYEGETLLIPSRSQTGDSCVQSYFYTELSLNGGTKYELPYPGAMATSQWDLQGIESSGQKLQTLKSISVNGVVYILNLDGSSQTYYIIVDGSRQPVSYPTVDYNTFYSSINGQDYWNITQNGWVVSYGSYTQQSGVLKSAGSLVTTTGYDQIQKIWSANRYGYDYENSTSYLTSNGTRIDVNSGIYLVVWKVQVGNQTYYTTDSSAIMEQLTDNITGQTTTRNYFKTLDNQKIYFDWNNPASWQKEIHKSIPGTNYTKLIPFTSQPTQVFDKIVVYNITIPALNGNVSHTGVYFENGTEVPMGTAFKVIGTTYGPGTRNNFYGGMGASIPSINAPWNNSLIGAFYCITLEGQRIFSFQQFGWNGNLDWNSNKQWEFNGDPISGNRTVPIVQGGYCIYLNDTLKIDVTTPNVNGDNQGQYIVLTNGTRLNVQRIDSLNQMFTIIGTQMFLFRNVLTYYNVIDSGITYRIVDPNQSDTRQIFTSTTYQVPTISAGNSIWMNATSEKILRDDNGYYLVNASDNSRISLKLVDEWWGNLSDTIRSQVFTGQLSDYYPRFNYTTSDGVQYFVLDPSPVMDRWNGGDWSLQQALYRYPNSTNVTIDGTVYAVTLMQNGYWNYNLTIIQINTINLDGDSYELGQQNSWTPSYQVIIDSQNVPVQMETMNVYKTHQAWGNIFTWRLTDLGISTSCKVNNLIVGTPQFGMWGMKAFKIVEGTGAIDLDGITTTTNDQYFVRKIRTSTELRNETIDRMWVDLNWNPNSTRMGDEVRVGAWMGKLHVSWTTQWTESYIWYHSSDMSGVSSQEMNQIRNTVINSVTNQTNPGYWDIGYMVQNQTWADVLAKAKDQNWNWISSNTNEWNWIWFGTNQNYNVNVLSNNGTSTAGVDLKYEFAGLNLLNDTQQTHYFMPTSVQNISFITPGKAFGNLNSSGNMVVPLNATIDFGVAYQNVNGTLFPYSDQRSMWGWWDRPIFGADFNSPDFNSRPTDSSIDKLSFMVHFGGTQTANSSQYNTASMKIDQLVGNWNLDPSVIDGRSVNSSGIMVPLSGNDVLANRSLAINYYVTASTSMNWNVKGDSGSSIDNKNATQSSKFDLGSQLANVTFASVKLGSTYDWGKPSTATDDVRTFNVTSQTTSIQNFQSSYQSDAGKSSTGFDISSSMYFLTQSFPKWDGYQIYNDPEVSVVVSKGTDYQPMSQPTPPPTTQPTPPPTTQPTPPPTTQPTPPPTTQPTPPPTTQPTPKPSQIPNTTPTPQPDNKTPQPNTTQPMQTSTVIIAIAIGAAIAIAAGSLIMVRKKKK
jgi:hypothetical protein